MFSCDKNISDDGGAGSLTSRSKEDRGDEVEGLSSSKVEFSSSSSDGAWWWVLLLTVAKEQ